MPLITITSLKAGLVVQQRNRVIIESLVTRKALEERTAAVPLLGDQIDSMSTMKARE